jgi:RNA-binding protein YlmH
MIDENDLLIAKVLDKKKICNSKNKITYTDFLNEKEQRVIEKNVKLENAFFYGVNENADRKILVFYPEKLTEELVRKSLKSVLSGIRIILKNDQIGNYEHKNYLSALIKIGIDRGKIGDILVDDYGADIIAFDMNKEFIIQSLSELTRFRKANIDIIPIDDIKQKIDRFEESTIIVSSMRIDNIVAELAGCSRTNADEYINSEKVFVNYETVLKVSKTIFEGDIVTIRGKGKFRIDGLVRNTRNNRFVIKVNKYA